jgi:hypothetical protein
LVRGDFERPQDRCQTTADPNRTGPITSDFDSNKPVIRVAQGGGEPLFRYHRDLGRGAGGADIDVIAHQTNTVKNWMKASREKGLKGVLTNRDCQFAKNA